MPDAPVISTQDLMQLYNQQNPGQPPPTPQTIDPNQFPAGGSPAMNALHHFNDFMDQQPLTPPQAPAVATDSTGSPVGPAHTAAPGMVPTGGVPTTPGATGGPQTPGSTGGNPPPAAPPQISVSGQGIITPNTFNTTPSAGLDNGNSLPAAPAGGHNMRIQNGADIKDIQYSPNANGQGMTATTMRDAGTGLTFQQGPNGQFYPSGSMPSSPGGAAVMPGMSFDNAQTNVNWAGQQNSMANRAGVPMNPLTSQVAGELQLMGVPMNSPIGQRYMAERIGDWNRNQTALGVAQISAGPANDRNRLAADLVDPAKERRNYALKVSEDVRKEFPALPTSKQDQMVADRMRHYDSALPTAQGGRPGGSAAGQTPAAVGQTPAPTGQSPATAAIGGMNAAAGSPFGDAEKTIGGELYNQITSSVPDGKGGAKPAVPIAELMTNIYRYDQQHPGYMRQNGQLITNLIRSNYGPRAIEDVAGLGMGDGPLSRGLGMLFNSPSEQDVNNARGAWRNALGLTNTMPGWMSQPAFIK